MREIKFRAWNTQSNKMISHELIVQDFIMYEELCHPLERNIFMQYTGMKDNNNVEIYEGDILSYRVSSKERGAFFVYCSVEYSDNKFVTRSPGKSFLSEAFGNTVVVGNIYENKELLDEQN